MDTSNEQTNKEVATDEEGKKPQPSMTCPTPAVVKRSKATRTFVVNSPTDHIFSPCTRKLLRKRTDRIKPENDL